MGKTLLKGGQVITLADELGDFERADILIDGTTIAAVGPDLEAPDAVVVDAQGMLVIPGMSDTHVHLWEALFRGRASESWGAEFFPTMRPLNGVLTPQDVYVATRTGALELLSNGTTAVLEFCPTVHSPEHADAALQALRETGMRGVFAFDVSGSYSDGPTSYTSRQQRFNDAARLAGTTTADDRIKIGVALSVITSETRDVTTEEVTFARSIGAPITFHYNTPGMMRLLSEWDLLGPDMVPAHGNWATDDDLQLLADVGGHLSVTTEAESLSGNRPMTMTGRAHKAGVRVSLGVDIPAMVSANIAQQMRYTYLLQRVLDGIQERYEAQVPVSRRPGLPSLTARDVFRFGTRNGVEAMGFAGVAGQIAPGFRADLTMINTREFGMSFGDPAVHVVLNTGTADISAVTVDGEFLKRDGRLVGVDMRELAQARAETQRRVLDASGEFGKTEPPRFHWDWVPDAERY